MAPPITCSCGECAKCKRRVYMRDYYRRNAEVCRRNASAARGRRLEAVRAYDRARSPAKKAATPPEKLRAVAALGRAVRRGEVTRLPCEVCGREPAEGSAPDYDCLHPVHRNGEWWFEAPAPRKWFHRHSWETRVFSKDGRWMGRCACGATYYSDIPGGWAEERKPRFRKSWWPS